MPVKHTLDLVDQCFNLEGVMGDDKDGDGDGDGTMACLHLPYACYY